LYGKITESTVAIGSKAPSKRQDHISDTAMCRRGVCSISQHCL